MTLLAKACKVSSRAMKPSTWSSILELAVVASVFCRPVRAVYSKRFGLATQIHGHVYQPRITAATHDNRHELIHYSNHQLDLNGETYASTQTTLFLVLVYPVWWTQMLEKKMWWDQCVYTFACTCHCYTPRGGVARSLLPNRCPLDPARMHVTLVVETFGLWSSHSLLKSIARRSALHNHVTVSHTTSHLHQQLSIKLWLYNSKMVLERLAFDSREDI